MLTEEQERIANHTHGPALVFAVAGSGKTHTMVERMKRLVEGDVFGPRQILATTFNSNAKDEINNRLSTIPSCALVTARTLHSLGNEILRSASGVNLEFLETIPYKRLVEQIVWSIKPRYRENRPLWYTALEELDFDAFNDWVGRCKGNLKYADLDGADLPPNEVATQATAPAESPWYLIIYQELERSMRKNKQITFDDMLMLGWEYLMRFPQTLKDYQNRFHCVIVDEFQDLNLAQAEMLHLIACEHKNYMAIGDDDQTIYEWRGASTDFIAGFESRYQAIKYVISDNFRCQAAPVALANAVIRHNRNREPKALSLTKEFRKGLEVVRGISSTEMANGILDRMEWQHEHANVPWKDMAILLRVHAQTAPFEVECRRRNIPFAIVDSLPFFKTEIVKVIQAYGTLVQTEIAMDTDIAYGNDNLLVFEHALKSCINKPSRYANEEFKRSLVRSVGKGRSPTQSLRALANQVGWKGRPLLEFAKQLASLSEDLSAIDLTGADFVRHIVEQTGYGKSIHSEDGETSIEILAVALAGCTGLHACLEFIRNEQALSDAQLDSKQNDRVKFTTIFKAKGLEWPIVAVPNVNAGYYPYPLNKLIEEERRIFYVALTRAKDHLYLGIDSTKNNSIFMDQADLNSIDQSITDLERLLLDRSPESWSALETYHFAQSVETNGFFRYLSAWAVPGQHFGDLRVVQAVERILSLHDVLKLPLHAGWQELDPLTDREIDHLNLQELQEFLMKKQEEDNVPVPIVIPKATIKPRVPDVRFGVNSQVSHPKLGQGTVLVNFAHGADRKITVRFADGSERSLVLGIAVASGLHEV
jgi:DNA helicase-2/ATP-dependent DNA helicase PcrA